LILVTHYIIALFGLSVNVSSSIFSGCNGVSRGEEKDPACDMALTSNLYTHEPDAAQALKDRPLSSMMFPSIVALPITVIQLIMSQKGFN